MGDPGDTARMLDMSYLLANGIKPLTYLLLSSERVYWLYLLSALSMALLLLMLTHRDWGLKQALAFCFPRALYTHPSAKADYGYFYLNALIQLLIWAPLFVGLSPAISTLIQQCLLTTSWAGLAGTSSFGLDLVYTIALAIAIDFAISFSHWLQHKVPVLWEFHKTHHSAEVLTPMTVYRMHPMDDLLNFTLTGILSGALDGVFQSLYSGHIGVISVFGLNLVTFLFYLLGYNLRHTHIWLDYGPFWSRVFISPVQHQIHHSTNPAHFDKNMGFIFAWWDILFGTLYVPKGFEQIEFGLNRQGEHQAYHSVRQLFCLPFQKAGVVLGRSALQGLLILGVLGLGLILGLIFQPTALPPTQAPEISQHTVFLEELTTLEVADRLRAGDNIILIPTGGTEQNGAHIILGKHNQIVRYTAGEIARRLGHTLVAPVIAYVPEAGHMNHAGTLDLPEPDFERLLIATAKSLKKHGFRWICFVGDSGWNQQGQKNVANLLNAQWQKEGVHVLAMDEYYYHSLKDLNQHAQAQDTSEMLVVQPSGIRQAVMPAEIHASKQYGEALLENKINAAIRQFHQARNRVK